MTALFNMVFSQNLLFPAALTRAAVVLTTQRHISKNVVKKLNLPSPPKRPGSAYAKFVQIQSPILRKKNPDAKQSDILILAGSLWKSADEKLKEKLEADAASEKELYKKQKAEYEEVIKPHKDEIIKQQEIEDRKKERKELARLGKPKLPGSAFTLFVVSQKDSKGSLSVTDHMKIVGAKWKALSPEEKAVYTAEYEKIKKKYLKEKKAWEEKMALAAFDHMSKTRKTVRSKTPIKKQDGKVQKGKQQEN